MSLAELCEKIATILKGTFVRATWQSVVPTPKKEGHTVIKVTTGIVRIGVDYENIASVKAKKEAKRAAGIPVSDKEGKLPAGESWTFWTKDEKGNPKPLFYTLTTEHGYLLRLTRVNNPIRHPHSYYLVDGKKMTKEEVVATGYVAPSYLEPHSPDSPIFTVMVDNVLELGK
jgi:hypothetical protein